MSDHEIYYWAARVAEERQIAASLPDGPPASVHRELADLYEQVLRRYTDEYQARKVADATDQCPQWDVNGHSNGDSGAN